ncbi:Hypothetical protein FKW44_022594, partial [Caligus rogercresseyi]
CHSYPLTTSYEVKKVQGNYQESKKREELIHRGAQRHDDITENEFADYLAK